MEAITGAIADAKAAARGELLSNERCVALLRQVEATVRESDQLIAEDCACTSWFGQGGVETEVKHTTGDANLRILRYSDSIDGHYVAVGANAEGRSWLGALGIVPNGSHWLVSDVDVACAAAVGGVAHLHLERPFAFMAGDRGTELSVRVVKGNDPAQPLLIFARRDALTPDDLLSMLAPIRTSGAQATPISSGSRTLDPNRCTVSSSTPVSAVDQHPSFVVHVRSELSESAVLQLLSVALVVDGALVFQRDTADEGHDGELQGREIGQVGVTLTPGTHMIKALIATQNRPQFCPYCYQRLLCFRLQSTRQIEVGEGAPKELEVVAYEDAWSVTKPVEERTAIRWSTPARSGTSPAEGTSQATTRP